MERVLVRMLKRYDMVVVGGGVLGVAMSYYLAFLNPGSSIAVVEREGGVARHASGRNTGKVHAPYLYDPDGKGISARAAFAGYSMWKEYAGLRKLPFKDDGVAEIAIEEDQVGALDRHYRWGLRNGLAESDMEVFDGRQFRGVEPEVLCEGALVCRRDASVDYPRMVESLSRDAEAAGATFLFNREATALKPSEDGTLITLDRDTSILAGFVVNAGGGQAVDLAHQMGVGESYTDVHFRGEYWRAPAEYGTLTGTSVYSVPKYPQYPFLDPHWIVRVDGTCEVGPNATPVFSPYGYDLAENARCLLPKTLEMLGSGARKVPRDPLFREMAAAEVWSSISKEAMIGRVRRFIPRLNPLKFTSRGTAGIRSSVIDADGAFVADVVVLEGPGSVHVLNYNSPGATGALPFSAHLVEIIHSGGLLRSRLDDAQCGPWRFSTVVDGMR